MLLDKFTTSLFWR